jgi:hypothetical protein
VTARDVRTQPHGGPGTFVQVYGFGGGMTAYALHLLLGLPLVPLSCELGSTWPVHTLTVIAVGGILTSATAALVTLRAGRAGTRPADPALDLRRVFLGTTGLLLNGLALLTVVYADIPNQILNPCLP